jgi:hypothetical protein
LAASGTVEGTGSRWVREDEIRPLACRYYRVNIGSNVKQIHIRVAPVGPSAGELRAAVLSPNGVLGQRCSVVLEPGADGAIVGTAPVPASDPPHLTLAVANVTLLAGLVSANRIDSSRTEIWA